MHSHRNAHTDTYKANQHDVIQQQHDCCKLIRDFALAKCIVAKVADVLDLRVLHDEFVHCQRSDIKQDPAQYHSDDSGYPSKDTSIISIEQRG